MRNASQTNNFSRVRRSLNEASKFLEQAQTLRGDQMSEIDAQLSVLRIRIDFLISLVEASEGITIKFPTAAKSL